MKSPACRPQTALQTEFNKTSPVCRQARGLPVFAPLSARGLFPSASADFKPIAPGRPEPLRGSALNGLRVRRHVLSESRLDL
eukprot:CAMPEP_0170332920 /NCGR_PEP_ID=MMETSP0116_2-20130129/67475_1 /TAXON_ID=400756 /ORGANISM="Durinskia baltica, Strain CSIRO CS-38" /LENGTH=81 /DNA_ID=CAMNT_0010586253 /DNA_START=46 /DNA_END=291 /DNA_ORIENTATION=-